VYSKHQQGTNPVPIMLLESGQDKSCILSHITDPVQTFECKMKNYMVNEEVRVEEAPPTNFSYSISLCFSVLNKLRIKNETDRFGYGRCPWSLEPASIFLFTNGNPQVGQDFHLFTKWKTLSEYVNHIYKWDHRVFLFVMFNQEDSAKCTVPSHLAGLCATTGGEVFICKTMKDAYESVKNLSTRLLTSHPSVAVKFHVVDANKGETIGGDTSTAGGGNDAVDGATGTDGSGDAFSSGMNENVGVGARLVVRSVGEWPIPEQGWIDIRDVNGKLPIRDAIPLLSVLKGNSLSVTTSKSMLQLAKDLDVHPDTYEINMNGARALDLDKNDVYPVYVTSSWRHLDSGAGADVSSTANPPEPFGLLCTGSKTGIYQLVVLPFNFPKCLQLLGQVLEPIKAGKTTQDLNMLPWMGMWRSELTAYLQSVPPYYYPPMARMLKKHQLLKLAFPGNQQNVLDYELHRKPSQRIKKAQNEASADMAYMDIVAREQWSKSAPHPNVVALATSVHAQQNLSVGAGTLAMPKAVSDVHETDLLSVWEKMRQTIFGGGPGLTVRGLSVQGITGTSGRSSKMPFNSSEDWLQQACGGSQVPRESTRDMSNYLTVLARQECLRDANLLDAPADEDSELGVLKRKLTPPNFGNRYSGKKSAKSGMEIEGISPSEGLFQTIPSIPLEIGKQAPLSLLEETANASVHALFMDTPAPYLEDDYLQSVGDTSDNEDGMDISSGKNQWQSDDEVGKKAVLESSASSLLRETATSVPKIGKPTKRSPRPHSLPYTASLPAQTTNESAIPLAIGSATATPSSSAATPVAPAAAVGSTVSPSTSSDDEPASSSSRSPTSVAAMPGVQSPSSSPGSASPSSTPASPSGIASNEEWVKHFSQKHNRPYWFNSTTGKSVWSDPNSSE